MDYKVQWKNAEKRFLSYLFADKKYIAMSMGKIKHEHLPNTCDLYELIIRFYNKYSDIISDERIESWFSSRNVSEDVLVNYKILTAEVKTMIITSEGEFEAIIDELREYKDRKELWDMSGYIQQFNPIHCTSDQLKSMKEDIKKKVAIITSEQAETKNEGTIKDSVKSRRDKYQQIKTNPELIKTIPTGFKTIDTKEGGFRPGELVYVIGRKGDGKSVLLLNLAHNVWSQGANVILFSLEISKEDYERRFDSRAAMVSSNGLKRGTLNEKEEVLYEQYLSNIEIGLTPAGKKAGIFYVVDCPAGCTPAFIDSKVDIIEQTLGIKFDVIISDYSGIMQPNIPVEQKRHEQGQIALDLKRIARTRGCVVVSAAQMSRKGKDDTNAKEGRADSAHVAESDQVADHIDWGIAIRSLNEMCGVVESFKTRDAEPFKFQFNKKYSKMYIEELDDSGWNDVGGPL
jgi:replicative DNA helicase